MSTTIAQCECGNAVLPGDTVCQWCEELETMKESQSRPHTWQRGRLTGTLTCRVCHLLPVDPSDHYTDCEDAR